MSSVVGERSPIRTAVRLAAFAGLALLAEPLCGVVDTWAAGYLGVRSQAALALGAGIVTATTWLVAPILFAQTTDVARAHAAGRFEDAAALVRGGLMAATAFGAVLAAGIVALAVLVDLSAETSGFLLARAAGLPVVAFVLAGYGALRGSGAVRVVTVLALGGATVHIVLDVVVVTATGLGVTGLGLASTLSQAAVAVLMLRALCRRGLLARDRTSAGRRTEWRSSVSAVGLLATRASMLGGSLLIMTATAVGIGPTAGAAHQVTYQFWQFAVLAVEGWKSAAQIVVSSARTPAERGRVELDLLRASVVLGVAAAAIAMVAMVVVVDPLAADAGVAATARSVWWLAALSLVVGAVAYTRDGIEYGRREYAANLLRAGTGTAVWLAGAIVAHLTADLVWIWSGIVAGLVVRAAPRPRFEALRPLRAPRNGPQGFETGTRSTPGTAAGRDVVGVRGYAGRDDSACPCGQGRQ